MTPTTVKQRAERVASVRADTGAAKHQVRDALIDVRAIRAWADAQEAALIQQLRAVDSFPESTIAETNRCSVGAASKTTERSSTLSDTPTLADALADGAITAGHIDAVTRASKKLDQHEQRQELLDRADDLANVAAAGTVEQFGRRLDLEVKKLQSDDGEARFTRQRRNTRVSTWTDNDGMWNLHAKFDPLVGARLASRLDATVDTLFTEKTPELCPTDPIEKQKFLNAHALARLAGIPRSLLEGAPDDAPVDTPDPTPLPTSRRPEMIIVVDADAPGGTGPVADFGIPVEVPGRVLADLAGDADVHAVVVRNGVVLHVPGNLDLGRSTRLANRAQRRALNALYRACAIPGCTTHYNRCKLHHIIWWRNGGRTDLSNLLPVCAAHHNKIHNDGWVVKLGPNRQLTLTLPDGTVRSTGPPSRQSAA